MHPFKLDKAKDVAGAIQAFSPGAKYIGGGTNLLDLMKLYIETPEQLIDVNKLDLVKIEKLSHGGVLIGALVRNSDLAYDKTIRSNYPMLSEAILSGASPQLRNMATTGGNLLQRTRCPYFFDTVMPCNKRTPGSGCSAIKGYNRMHAVLGTSEACIATHPSDMAVALAALDAVVHVQGKSGKRTIAFTDFHKLPGDTPHIESTLQEGELITGVEIPGSSLSPHSTYVKIRDRHSYEFALASAAVAMKKQGGTIQSIRIALGGVATKPWRAHESEQVLINKKPSADLFSQAADAAFSQAKTYEFNAFKPALGKRAIISALQKLEEA